MNRNRNITLPAQRFNGNRARFVNDNQAKEWLELNIQKWCNDNTCSMEKNYAIDAEKKIRFTWAIPAYKIAVEFDSFDLQKKNKALRYGWRYINLYIHNYQILLSELNK